MKTKKIYETPKLEFIHVGIPSILAGTANNESISTGTIEPGTGGEEVIGDGDPVLSRRGGFWDDDF